MTRSNVASSADFPGNQSLLASYYTLSEPKTPSVSQHLDFFREFIRRPGVTGAVAPSSRFLAERMLAGLDLASARVIVEVGPGTGSFTRAILNSKRADARLLALEVNPRLAQLVRERFAEVEVFEESPEHLPLILERAGLEGVDLVVSGLPWAVFPPEKQALLLGAIRSCLKPGGRFATFAYLQGLLLEPGRRFRRRIHHQFASVHESRVVWRNLPPAFVYTCVKGDAPQGTRGAPRQTSVIF